MQYGVCTWTFGDQPLVTTAKTLAAIGFDGVELLGDLALYSAQAARTILDDHGLSVLSLTPTDADISHPEATTRQQALDYYFRLLDFAAALGNPLISCHGLVGRIAPIGSQAAEDALLIESVQHITERAAQSNLKVVFEVLNRYETHQIHNHAQALQLVADVNAGNFGVLLDAYHMNIEEANPAAALRKTGAKLWLYHAADSNRLGIGKGHTDFTAQATALTDIRYDGAVIFECSAPGPNPFTPDKGANWRDVLKAEYHASLSWWQQRAFTW